MEPFEHTRGRWHGLFHPSVAPHLAARWLASPTDLIHGSAPWHGAVDGGPWFAKYREAGLLRTLRSPFGDRFTGSLALGMTLEERGISTCRPLALLRGPGQRGEGRLLLMEKIEGVELGAAWKGRNTAERMALLVCLAKAIASLHDAGFRQRDLKAPNIMVEASGAITLVDLEGMRDLQRSIDEGYRAKDLGRLAASFQSDPFRAAGVTAEDWNMVLNLYCEACEADTPRLDWLRSQTAAYALKKVAKNQRTGRPLA